MLNTIQPVSAIRMLLSLVALTATASAAELSPWLGSADQPAFRLDAKTMLAATAVADPMETGSTTTIPSCPPKGCTPAAKPATSSLAVSGAPQN